MLHMAGSRKFRGSHTSCGEHETYVRPSSWHCLTLLAIAKAYDFLERSVIIRNLLAYNVPHYIVSWVHPFLSNIYFFCRDGSGSSVQVSHLRGVPQGSVLSPLLFNIVMRPLPLHPSVSTITYTDDIAFFSCAPDIHEVYRVLQNYLALVSDWVASLSLTINASKSAVMVFSPGESFHLDLEYRLQAIPPVQSLKYLGVVYDPMLRLNLRIGMFVAKGLKYGGIVTALRYTLWSAP